MIMLMSLIDSILLKIKNFILRNNNKKLSYFWKNYETLDIQKNWVEMKNETEKLLNNITENITIINERLNRIKEIWVWETEKKEIEKMIYNIKKLITILLKKYKEIEDFKKEYYENDNIYKNYYINHINLSLKRIKIKIENLHKLKNKMINQYNIIF